MKFDRNLYFHHLNKLEELSLYLKLESGRLIRGVDENLGSSWKFLRSSKVLVCERGTFARGGVLERIGVGGVEWVSLCIDPLDLTFLLRLFPSFFCLKEEPSRN